MPALEFWSALSGLAGRYILVPATILLITYLLYNKKKKDALLVFFAWYGGTALSAILKRIFQLSRPENPLIPIDGYAFPSGHALSAVIFYSLLMIIFSEKIKNKLAKIIFISANILIILLVGLSRIILQVHYVRDVIGGYVIGLVWLFVIYYFLENKKVKRALKINS